MLLQSYFHLVSTPISGENSLMVVSRMFYVIQCTVEDPKRVKEEHV